MTQITKPSPLNPIVNEEGIAVFDMALWLENINNLSMVIDSGSPEGIVEGIQGRQYMDQAGTTGSILYIKKLSSILGDTTKGWVLV